ncbi:hypothetical protein Ddye_003997 [Dipteronia dyeriana]|uniref:Uncharacterized protein n=1 Tax=Dipteronia dyeriana TaxID=168575 RepID=A0AAD9XUR8_9ROSI|nr:hypothetical protein Ddye_003997 [Dipteronia dyeriana]
MTAAQVSQVSDTAGEIVRRTADFPPSIWGDCFINYDSEQTDEAVDHASQLQEIEELKEQVRKELLGIVKHSLSQLNFIDVIERLGLGYHFETEIRQVLQHLNNTYNDGDHAHQEFDDLHTAALRFRLLRQHGYHVSCDIFNKLKDDKGNFMESLASDVSGMLSLYEAAHVGVHGEDILDEAIAFTTAHLQSSMATNSTINPLAAQVIHALHKPLHKRVLRIEARHYISIYQDDPSHNQALLKLAKIDFNLLQSLHKKEISQLCRWSKNWDFTGKLPFARDRLVEGYFWVVGMVHEPQHSLARIIIAKAIHILTIVDDLYDAYGTLEELTLFAEATERWDASCMDQLPEYMHIIYKSFLEFSGEVEEEIADKEWSSYRVHCAKEVIKNAVRASFDEAKWIDGNRIPTMEEYLQASLVTAGVGTITILLLITMDLVTKETFDWVLSRPTVITTSELHFRLMDDLRSHKVRTYIRELLYILITCSDKIGVNCLYLKPTMYYHPYFNIISIHVCAQFERERGHTTSSVEIYMKQYGVTEKEAYEELQKLLTWKDVNEEFLKHSTRDNHHLPSPVPVFILNFPRMIHLIYEKEDNYTSVGKEMKAYIESLLIDPVPI